MFPHSCGKNGNNQGAEKWTAPPACADETVSSPKKVNNELSFWFRPVGRTAGKLPAATPFDNGWSYAELAGFQPT